MAPLFLTGGTPGGCSLLLRLLSITTPPALEQPGRPLRRSSVTRKKKELSFTVLVCKYPEGCKDFDDLLKLEGGKAEEMLQNGKAAARYFAEYFGEVRAPEIAAEHTGGKADKDILRPYFKEELTRLLAAPPPASETGYFEHLLNDILEAYFLKWDEIKHEAENLREIEAAKRYRQEAGKEKRGGGRLV